MQRCLVLLTIIAFWFTVLCGQVWATDFTATISGADTFDADFSGGGSGNLGGINGCAMIEGTHSYSADPLLIDTSGTYTFTATGSTGDFDDPFMAVYSPTFDAANPTNNLVACNDDTNGLLPEFSATLSSGTSYVIVTTTFGVGVSSGTVDFTITPDVTLLTPGNGQCGNADGTTASSAPSGVSLCDTGTPSTVSDDGTTYTWTCYGVGSGMSDDTCSATMTLPPTVTTQAVTNIAATTATGNGTITNLGTIAPTTHGVCWSTSADPTVADNKTDNGTATSIGTFTADITGLSPSTTYHLRAFATNGAGTAYGDDVTFTTGSADSDGDGIVDDDEGTGDTDGDGTPDNEDTDSDGDGIDDEVEGNVDSDGDGTPDFQDPESDGDGVGDAVENGAANDGDGNSDGTPDRLQARVTTLMTYDETNYVTFESPEGTALVDVQAIDNPSPGDMPEGSGLTYGLFDFTINNIEPGGNVELTLYLPENARPDSYLKYGPTPDDETDHWYEFVYDGVTGAEINGNVITLHFVDGNEGDDDLTENGVVIDAGGPMADTWGVPDGNDYGPTGSGCFVDGLASDGNSSGLATGALSALLALAALLRFSAIRRLFVAAGLVTALIVIAPGAGQADGDTAEIRNDNAPFYLTTGIGFAWIDENIGAEYQGATYKMKVDNDIYPVFRLGYAFSDNLALELGFRWDIYSGEMDRSSAGGSDNPRGYTFLLGPVYTFGEYQCKYLGPINPMVHLNLGYTLLHDDTDYPIGGFDPALGVDIAVGVQRKSIDLRLGYRYFDLDGGDLQEGVNSADDSLNLSGVYMEVAWRFDFGK